MSEFEICEWRRCFLLSRSRQMFWVWSVACISHSDICRGLIEFNPNTCSSDQPTIDLVIQARRWRQHAKTTRCGISRRHGDSSPTYGWLCNLRTFLTIRRRDRRILMWWHSKNFLNRWQHEYSPAIPNAQVLIERLLYIVSPVVGDDHKYKCMCSIDETRPPDKEKLT